MFTADQIDPEPTPGLRGQYLYRRVRLDQLQYDGKVRYAPELEQLVDDVPAYIAAYLTRRESRLGGRIVESELYSPLDIPLPDHD